MTCCDNPAGYSADRVRSSRKGGGEEAHEKIIYFFIPKDDGTRRQRQRNNNNNKSARACVRRRISYTYIYIYMRPSWSQSSSSSSTSINYASYPYALIYSHTRASRRIRTGAGSSAYRCINLTGIDHKSSTRARAIHVPWTAAVVVRPDDGASSRFAYYNIITFILYSLRFSSSRV